MTKHFIAARIVNDNFNLVFSVYISQSHDIKNVLSELKESINFVMSKFPDDPLIVGGDFNFRVGSYTNILEDFYLRTQNYAVKDKA